MIDRMKSSDVSRRQLIQSAAFVPLAALVSSAQQPSQTALTPAQMKTLVAFIDRLIPSDELGPGAVASGAQIYIDRALAGPNASEKDTFVRDSIQSTPTPREFMALHSPSFRQRSATKCSTR